MFGAVFDSAGAQITVAQRQLLTRAWRMASRTVEAAQREFCVEAYEVFIVLVDIRGSLGRRIGAWALGQEAIAARLDRTGIADAVPLAIPLSLNDGEQIVDILAPRLSLIYMCRPPNDIPVLLIDHLDNGTLAFASPRKLVRPC
jgi:hypothetical protein